MNEISLGLVLHMVMGQRYEFRLAQMVLLVCAAIKVLLYVHGENKTCASGGAYTKEKAGKVI